MSFFRIDRASKTTVKTTITKTDEGYLEVVAPIARVGVYNYILPNGTLQREYIPPTTLFNQDSLQTLQLKPVTNNHPSDFVNTDSYKELSVGSVGETIHQDGDKLLAKFIVTAQDAIDDVNEGKVQLSPAYSCDLDFTSGISPNGEHYDAIQTNRVYNHLAIVDRARGGDELNFKLDSNDNIAVQTDNNPNIKGDGMKTVHIDGVNYEIGDEAVASHISALTVKADSLKDEVGDEKAKVVTLQAKLDSAEDEFKALKLKAEKVDNVEERVEAKLALMNTARGVLGEDGVKTTDSDEAIMTAVVLKVSPNAKLDSYEGEEKSIYLKARFDSAVESFSEDEDNMETQRTDMSQTPVKKTDARAEHDKKRQNKWKGVK